MAHDPLDTLLDDFLTTHHDAAAFDLVAAAMERMAEAGVSRDQAIAALQRWIAATAAEYQG
jgi:hypothetical protein